MTASTLKTNTALVSFAASARNMAKAEGKVSDLLATVRADLAAFIKAGGKQPEARALFLQVNVSVILGVTMKAAALALSKKVPTATSGAGDDVRTADEQKAERNANKRWSRVLESEGVKSTSKKGGARVSKVAAKDNAKASDVRAETTDPVPLAKVSIPRAKGVENVREFADLMAATVSKFMKANGAVSFDVYGGIFETFVASVKNAKVEQASKASANVATPAPIVNLNVVRDDASINARANVKHSGVSDFIATQPKARKSRGK